MNVKRLFGMTFLTLLCLGTVKAQQPYGGCWHPKDIKDWSPKTDPNAKFNRSRVRLAPRFREPMPMKANRNQYYEGQVCNASILFPTCSLCPSQGANNFVGYQPTYWQYMDKLVYWAGSASEGIIIPPPAGSIDAAHASGVKVLGQIFFPPNTYGGNPEWVYELLKQENGKYIYAIKLYEIAKYLGFDGWFINQETAVYFPTAWPEFIKEFNRVADEAGDTQMEIQWYNASHQPNVGILASHKNTSQFLEYGSVGDYRSYADRIGCKQEDIFSKIYGGIQCVDAGLCGFGDELRKVFDVNGHSGSVDLFCPEERIWKDNVKDLLNTSNNQGQKAYTAMQYTFMNEEATWVNRLGDPSKITDNGTHTSWPGMSGCVIERSAIQQMPFVSDMSVGIGKYRFVKGEKLATQDWYHSGMQSVLPTWRWWIENRGDLKVATNWADAYNVSNSMTVSGKLSQGDHLMRLYKTKIDVTKGGKFKLVYKCSDDNTIEVKLGVESKVDGQMVTLNNPVKTNENGWTVAEYDLSPLNGQTVYMIALNLKTNVEQPNYVLSIGQIAMLPANYVPKQMSITNLSNGTKFEEYKGDLRLTWDWEENTDLDHFDIYVKSETGENKLVGQTRGEGFYVPAFDRNGKDKKVEVEVVPVMKDGSEQTPAKLDVDYPAAQLSVVTISPSKSFVKVGEEVTLRAKGTGKPTGWKWTLPETLELKAGSKLTDNTITVIAKAVGKQNVKLEATNDAGTSSTEVCAFDVLEEHEIQEVNNVALHKTIKSYSGATGDAESPRNIIDGDTNPRDIHNKWCNINSTHECVIDLQGDYRIYGFKIFDCKSGPESNENFGNYRIYLSEDGINWKLLVDEQGRERDNIKEDYIVPTTARYVKLNPYSDYGMTLRIWEFEVYGVSNSNLKLSADDEVRMNVSGTHQVVLTYDMNGEDRQDQFYCKVESSSTDLVLGEPVEDKNAHTFTVPVTTGKNMGVSSLKFMVHNGSSYKEKTVKVIIDDPKAVNALAGLSANLLQYPDGYVYNAPVKKYTTTALTDGDLLKEACGMVENPSKHERDFWAVFSNDMAWNISKIKIHIPNNNQGKDDNDVEGCVNNKIEIRVSDDGSRGWTTIHTFENIGKVSELEYMLPEYVTARELAIVCTLNPLFYPSLSEVEAFEQNKEAVATCIPVEVKEGWNGDVIVEALPADKHVTKTVDANGWTFYTTDIERDEGGHLVGANRMITTKNGNVFKLAPFDQNNALVIDKLYKKKTILFNQPEEAERIYVLYTSTGGGNNDIMVAPIYEDGTAGDEYNMNAVDWYGYDDNMTAVGGLGRIMAKDYEYGEAELDEFDFRNDFRVFEYEYDGIDKNKKVKGLTFREFSNGQCGTILAISKFGLPVPTGLKEIKNTTSTHIVGIYNLYGMKLQVPTKGFNIIKFADGTTKKVFIK